MSEQHNPTELPAVPADAASFAAVETLIRLVVNPTATEKRLQELRAAMRELAAAKAELAAKQAEHSKAVDALAAERAAVASEKIKAAEFWAQLNLREEELRKREAVVEEEHALREKLSGRYVPLPGGGCQDFGPSGPEVMPLAPLVRTPAPAAEFRNAN
jgi:septal ring factor EnvC (AmiA/AmiB activator)